MRILYGINGTGNGHLTKSLQIIQELRTRNHQVDILISGSKSNIVLPPNIIKKKGFTFIYKNGSIDFIKTALSNNIIKFLLDLKIDMRNYDKIITDFEPLTAWSSRIQKNQSIGISHQYAFASDKCPRPGYKSGLSEFFIKHFAPVDLKIGLHFEKYDNFIYHPIIRNDIIKSKPQNLDHITVYLPTHDIQVLKQVFAKWNRKVHIFTDVKKLENFKNLELIPLSLDTFTQSLTNCDLLITAGGFETPSEALFLKKKMIIIPIKGQYEQQCNAQALSQLGVRVEHDLEKISSLHSHVIDYRWDNPMGQVIDIILRSSSYPKPEHSYGKSNFQ